MKHLLFGVAALTAACATSPRMTQNPAPAPTQSVSSASALPVGVTPQMVALGDSLYHAPSASCHRCHAADATGGPNAPSLKTGAWLHSDGSYEKIVTTIIEGVPRDKLKDQTRRFAMNPRGGPMNLTDPQARALAAYVWSISREKSR